MIAVDSNVLVRVLAQDHAEQCEAARLLIARAMREGTSLFVPVIVVCETVWVLRSRYGFARAEVARAVSWMLAAEQLEVESQDELQRALAAYADGNGDIADYLIRERALGRGAHAVATFDRSLHDDDGFVEPDPNAWPDDLSLHERPPRYGRRRSRRTAAAKA